MHRKKLIIITASLLAFYAIAGFYILPAIVKPRMQEAMVENAKCPVIIGGLKINPFEIAMDLIIEEHLFEQRRWKISR